MWHQGASCNWNFSSILKVTLMIIDCGREGKGDDYWYENGVQPNCIKSLKILQNDLMQLVLSFLFHDIRTPAAFCKTQYSILHSTPLQSANTQLQVTGGVNNKQQQKFKNFNCPQKSGWCNGDKTLYEKIICAHTVSVCIKFHISRSVIAVISKY